MPNNDDDDDVSTDVSYCLPMSRVARQIESSNVVSGGPTATLETDVFPRQTNINFEQFNSGC